MSSKKDTAIEKIVKKYGNPVNFSDFRHKGSFTKIRNAEIENAINNDCYGAFRIACTLYGLTWRKICDLHSINYLIDKNASKILRSLIELGKEDKTTLDVWSILCHILKEEDANFENVVRGFAAYPLLEHNEKVEMLKAAMVRTDFVDTVFESCGTVNLIRIHDFFEELFPGENLFPARFGNWTDTRDGETYKTIRIQNTTEWLCAPLKYGMGPDGLISLDEFKKNAKTILPDGWRLPTEEDADVLGNERLLPYDAGDTSIFCNEDTSYCALLAKDSFWPITEWDTIDEDVKYGSEEWNRQFGVTGTDFRPTYGTGDSRESTVMTILCTDIDGKRGVGRLAFSLYTRGFEEPECVDKPWRYNAKVYERCCILLCRDIKN